MSKKQRLRTLTKFCRKCSWVWSRLQCSCVSSPWALQWVQISLNRRRKLEFWGQLASPNTGSRPSISTSHSFLSCPQVFWEWALDVSSATPWCFKRISSLASLWHSNSLLMSWSLSLDYPLSVLSSALTHQQHSLLIVRSQEFSVLYELIKLLIQIKKLN